MTGRTAVVNGELPIVAAFFCNKRNLENPGLMGVIVPIEDLPQYREKFHTYPSRFLLDGYTSSVAEGRPYNFTKVDQEHTLWVSRVFTDVTRERGSELWLYGVGYYQADRQVAVIEVDGEYSPPTTPEIESWLSEPDDPKFLQSMKAALEARTRDPKPVRHERAPRSITPSGSGGGADGKAVTKMTVEERNDYRDHLLSKPNRSSRDERHLQRILKMEGK